jgi:hypothetical protein
MASPVCRKRPGVGFDLRSETNRTFRALA